MNTDHVSIIRDGIRSRELRVAVIGLGYVGLPLAVALAEAGFRVTGIDVSEEKVSSIRAGKSPIIDIDADRLAPILESGRLHTSSDYADLAECHAIFVCVPTPFDRNKTPDLRFVISASESIAEYLQPGRLVILQSTTYPGTTEEIMLPRLSAAGFEAGKDLFLAFSPERIDPGVAEHTVLNTPKVIGGMTPNCLALASELLKTLGAPVHEVSSPRVAEMTKLLENIFRSVNIALVNELALLGERMDLDIWEVIEAASSKPFGFMPFWPGPGVGGHCIPIDPYYLSWKAREFDFSTRFIELAADINQAMPRHVINLAGRALDVQGHTLGDAKILIIGVAFKPNVDDARNSPADPIIAQLLERGSDVRYHDPHVERFTVHGHAQASQVLENEPLTKDLLSTSDLVIIVTPHSSIDYDWLIEHSPAVLDTTRATRAIESGKISRLGTAWNSPTS